MRLQHRERRAPRALQPAVHPVRAGRVHRRRAVQLLPHVARHTHPAPRQAPPGVAQPPVLRPEGGPGAPHRAAAGLEARRRGRGPGAHRVHGVGRLPVRLRRQDEAREHLPHQRPRRAEPPGADDRRVQGVGHPGLAEGHRARGATGAHSSCRQSVQAPVNLSLGGAARRRGNRIRVVVRITANVFCGVITANCLPRQESLIALRSADRSDMLRGSCLDMLRKEVVTRLLPKLLTSVLCFPFAVVLSVAGAISAP
mmetsp:Transcript_15405/g.40868  ORF Transcript_15405/g.40868 Transcript_15405/m.40868 type:complete len:255 (-) Transcript_15405:59-823(-)